MKDDLETLESYEERVRRHIQSAFVEEAKVKPERSTGIQCPYCGNELGWYFDVNLEYAKFIGVREKKKYEEYAEMTAVECPRCGFYKQILKEAEDEKDL